MNSSRVRVESKGSSNTRSSATPRRRTRLSSVTTVGRAETTSTPSVRSPSSRKRKHPGTEDGDEDGAGSIVTRRKRRRTVGPTSRKQRESPAYESEERDDEAHSRDDNPGPRSQYRQETNSEDDQHRSKQLAKAQSGSVLHRGKVDARALREEEEEEEEEEAERDGDTANRSNSASLSPHKPVPYVLVNPKSAAKHRDASPIATTSKNQHHDSSRTNDKRPTPPRRTLNKSRSKRPTDHGEPTVSLDRKGKKRASGTPASDVQTGSAESDRDNTPTLPRATDIGGPVRRGASGQRSVSRSPSIVPNQADSPLKSKQGLTSRMKGKKKAATNGVALLSEESSPQASRRASVDLSDGYEAVITGELVYDFNNLDDPIPFTQDDNPVVHEAETLTSKDLSGPREPSPAIISKVTESVLDAGTTSRDPQNDHDTSQLAENTIIPASLSQSQSPSQSQMLPSNEADVQFDSILAEHGSPAKRTATDVDPEDTAQAEPASSMDPDVQLDSMGTFVTDPESSVNTNAKAYKKIPVVTPSKFKPYLPQQKPLSTLPLPQVQGKNGIGNSARNGKPASSLESPVKDFDVDPQRRSRSGSEPSSSVNRNEPEEEDDIEDVMPHSLELRQRGLEIAEREREKLRQELRKPPSRVRLDALLEGKAKRSRSSSAFHGSDVVTSTGQDNETSQGPESLEEPNQTIEEDDEARVRQFEEDYLDFDGNAGVATLASAPENTAEGTGVQEEEEEEEEPAADDTSDAADVESSLQDAVDEDDPFVVHKAGRQRSTTPTTTTSQQEDSEPPYTPRFKILGSPSKLETSVVETPARQLNEAMGLLHAKSEEIEHLKRQLAESERKRLTQDEFVAELQAENAVLKKTQEQQPDASSNVEEMLLAEYKEKCEALTRDRDALEAEIKLLKLSYEDSAKNVEIFRELYGKASSYADEMKQENAELLARAKLAEGQVKVGLELVRRQHAVQLQKLRAELQQQRILCNLLTTRDTRTDDDVRHRAAIEPELQAKISELKEEIHDLEVSQSNILRERNALLVSKQELSEKLEEMRASHDSMTDEMCLLQIQIARLTAREKAFKKVFLTTQEYVDDNELDHAQEPVYICKWMMEHDSKSRCNSIFTSVQDLKDHLFVDHQL